MAPLEDFVPQMKKKGRLQEGMDADIVVFDPETISDVAIVRDVRPPLSDDRVQIAALPIRERRAVFQDL